MEKLHEIVARDDIIELGAASVETKGEFVGSEPFGDDPGQGISDK